MYSVSELAAKVTWRRQESLQERRTVIPSCSSVILPDVECNNVDCRFQITRTTVMFCGCFEGIAPCPLKKTTVNGFPLSPHVVVSMDYRLSYHSVSNLNRN